MFLESSHYINNSATSYKQTQNHQLDKHTDVNIKLKDEHIKPYWSARIHIGRISLTKKYAFVSKHYLIDTSAPILNNSSDYIL